MSITTITARTLALVTTALTAAICVAPAARAADVPHTQVRATTTLAGAADPYWTADRLKKAIPMELPRAEGTLDLKQQLSKSQSAPTHSEGSAPQVDVGNALESQLFTPDAAPAPTTQDTVIPDNVGNFGAYFTTTRVFPETATTTYPNSAAGKLFFTDQGTGIDYVCSASAISHRLVVTAGHCTAHADPSHSYFYSNWLFVPAYDNGKAPFGKWKPNFETTTANWFYSNGSVPNVQDVGILVMNDTKVKGTVQSVGNITGYLGWWTQWGRSYPNNVTQLGYPCNLDSCAMMELNTAQGVGISNNTVEIGSAMQGGSSGGPWIQDYGVYPTGGPSYTAGNWVLGVTSWGFTDTTQMAQGASIFENAGYPGNGFGDLWNAACAAATGNC
jgi:V8-like Glu-specific endopeptidase